MNGALSSVLREPHLVRYQPCVSFLVRIARAQIAESPWKAGILFASFGQGPPIRTQMKTTLHGVRFPPPLPLSSLYILILFYLLYWPPWHYFCSGNAALYPFYQSCSLFVCRSSYCRPSSIPRFWSQEVFLVQSTEVTRLSQGRFHKKSRRKCDRCGSVFRE